MSSLLYRISFPIILAGVFAISIFIALDYNTADPTFYITLLLLTLFTFFFGYAVGKNLSSPVKELLDKTRELRDGNLSTRFHLETKDELCELAKALNQIASELELNQEEKKQAQELIDISVRARTKDLEEVIKNLEQKVKNRTIELERLIDQSKKFQLQIKEQHGSKGKFSKNTHEENAVDAENNNT